MQPIPAHAADGPTRMRDTQGDFLLPPPAPDSRLPWRIDPVDLRRLDLYAVLTAAGIAPEPGDQEAVDQLSRLPGSVHEALHRWLAGR
ncbi:hypothetical protein [Streptomyces poriticola]|uniref:hypothetical protein n=1 Tax=Streptomyces poriticola TaxID=3120506 RepID=UPI002FCE5F0D